MLITVAEFCRYAADEGDRRWLVAALQDETGRSGAEEATAWDRSLLQLGRALDHDALKDFHVHLGSRGGISLEYRLPASSSWVDAVLLGRGSERAAAVFLEMKDWDTSGDVPGPRAGLIRHQGNLVLHPAEQLHGYVEYCRRFHSAVQDAEAELSGSVFFTASADIKAYSQPPHDELTTRYPHFSAAPLDMTDRFPSHLAKLLERPDPAFANAFEAGHYKQDRDFLRQVAESITRPDSTHFVLLDQQREGFEHCLRYVDEIVGGGSKEKALILVEGPPGSGKSLLAAHLWARLAADERITGNVVLTTTSAAQRTNWQKLFENVAGDLGGRGLVRPANVYNPGLTPIWVKEQRKLGRKMGVREWKQNLALHARSGKPSRCPDNSFDVSIVDEAHALMDPTSDAGRGANPAGWSLHAGPQAWHIMRASRISVFLLDGDQSFRDSETTSAKRISELAADLGITRVERVSLAGAQFRCGGSAEYVGWLDDLLDVGTAARATTAWSTEHGGPFSFEIVDHPHQLDDRLAREATRGAKVRLLASFARPWKTKDIAEPWRADPRHQDFLIEYEAGGERRIWTRPWNFAPAQDYTLFVQAPPGSEMAADPLAEVGCPYVVRGFDYDYLGVLWLSDLVWRDDRWLVNLAHVHETGVKNTKARARKEPGDGPATQELIRRLQRAYRILLSRAIRGVFVWFEDEETRRHVEAWLARER